MITPLGHEEPQQQTPNMHATSPWTEPFQRSYADAQAAPQDQQSQAQRPAHAEIDALTHDALSAIFNDD